MSNNSYKEISLLTHALPAAVINMNMEIRYVKSIAELNNIYNTYKKCCERNKGNKHCNLVVSATLCFCPEVRVEDRNSGKVKVWKLECYK